MNKKVKKMLNQAFCEIARLDADINELKQNPLFKIEYLDPNPIGIEGFVVPLSICKTQQNEEKEIDWDIPGQIVEKSDTGLIVMTTGYSYRTGFSGVVLEANVDWEKGEISDCWGKQHFKISNKTIKLE